MSDKIVTLAVYSNVIEAQLARNQLEAEGIRVEVAGDTGGMLPGMETMFGRFQLLVSEVDLERAAAVLGLTEEEAPSLPEEERPEEEHEPDTAIREQGSGGIRSARDEEPPPTTAVRPRSPTDRPAKLGTPESSAMPGELEEGDEELEEKVGRRFTYSAEELASRAFRVSLVGLLLFPTVWFFVCIFPAFLVPLYSLYLLFRMALLPEDVSQKAMLQMYVALVLDLAMLFGPLVLYVAGRRF